MAKRTTLSDEQKVMNKAYSLNYLVPQPAKSQPFKSESPVSAPKCAWLMIGIPGSGKTTFAHRLQRSLPHTQIVCPDQIRDHFYGSVEIQGDWAEIWQAVKTEFTKAYNLQNSVIYDATNCQRADRLEVIDLARTAGFNQINGLWLQAPLWLCLMRNQRRDRQVPEEVVINLHRHLQETPPQLQEGFSSLIYPKESQESEWLD